VAGFYGAPTKKDQTVILGNATNDQAWVFVVDVAALRANMARQTIAFRNPKVNGGTTK